MKLITIVLIICVLGLLAIGLVVLYSVSPLDDSFRLVSRQLLACAIGLAGATWAAARLDYRQLQQYSKPMYVLALVMLILVLIPGVGTAANGARRWFRLAGFQCQPSDFAKLALIVAVANYAARNQRFMQTFKSGLVLPAGMIGPMLVLIFLEPDWGTAVLLAVVTGIMLCVGGVRLPYVIPPMVLGLVGFVVLLALNPMRSDRLYSWLNLEETKDGIGYQAWQARIALGAGGPRGVGLDKSTQKTYVPEKTTDFIYAVIAEEFGYVGSLALVTAFVTMFLCSLAIAWRAPDAFGLLLGTGLSFLIALQAFINVAVVSGAFPNKGLSLPFVSYGGTNLMIMLLCIGILISIGRASVEATEARSSSPSLEQIPLTHLA